MSGRWLVVFSERSGCRGSLLWLPATTVTRFDVPDRTIAALLMLLLVLVLLLLLCF